MSGLCPELPKKRWWYERCDRRLLVWVSSPSSFNNSSVRLLLSQMSPKSRQQNEALESNRCRVREFREKSEIILASTEIVIQDCLDVSPQRKSIVLPGEHCEPSPTTQPHLHSAAICYKCLKAITRRQFGVY